MAEVSRAVERRLWKSVFKAFGKLINALKNGTGTIESTNRARKWIKKYIESKEMQELLSNSVGVMVKTVRTQSANELKQDILDYGGSAEMYNIIKNEMNGKLGELVWKIMIDDVTYFKSLPDVWIEYVRKYILEETMKGRRPDDIAKDLKKILPSHIKTNLKTVARTMSAKANAAIVQARAEMCGIRAYIWRSVKDERTRDAHRRMDGIVVYYDDPPSPEGLFPGGERIGKRGKPLAPVKAYGNYHAGNTYNCRCWQKPIVNAKMLPNTVKVYHAGKVQAMGKNIMMKKYGKVS